jgi:hypothetical protein
MKAETNKRPNATIVRCSHIYLAPDSFRAIPRDLRRSIEHSRQGLDVGVRNLGFDARPGWTSRTP